MQLLQVVALVLAQGLELLPSVHAGSPSSASSFKTILHFSDVHLNISHDEQQLDSNAIEFRYGDDAPLRLLDSSLQYAKQVLPHPDLFLFTGDNAPHGAKPEEFVAKSVDTNIRKLEEYFPISNVLMLEATAILGNGDTDPDYYMQVSDPDSVEPNPSIQMVSGAWKNSLSEENFDLFNRRGYLKYQLDDKLYLLTLNTVIYSPRHTPNTTSNADPFGQFAWLRKTLMEIRNNNDFAYIAGHIGPMVDWFGGNPQWQEQYIHTYKSIAREFSDVIRAQFFGHVHSIEFRIPRIEENTEFSMPPLFLSGALSPAFKNNPSFIVWEYDAQTYEVHDFSVYGTDLNEKEQKLNWQFLFEASSAYGLSDLSSESLRGLQQRMEHDVTLFDQYYQHIYANSPRTAKCDTPACRARFLCTLTWWATKKEYQDCVAQKTPPVPSNSSSASNSSNGSNTSPAQSSSPAPVTMLPTPLVPSTGKADHPATSNSRNPANPSTPSSPTDSPSPSQPSTTPTAKGTLPSTPKPSAPSPSLGAQTYPPFSSPTASTLPASSTPSSSSKPSAGPTTPPSSSPAASTSPGTASDPSSIAVPSSQPKGSSSTAQTISAPASLPVRSGESC